MTGPYNDIINLPHHVSATRPRMSAIDRAAQFAPFAALTGHEEAVKESARLTDARLELGEYVKDSLNEKLGIIAGRLEDCLEISITYFQPDAKKAGGAYVTAFGSVKKIDEYERIIIMANGIKIPIREIVEIDGEIFMMMFHR